MSITLNSLATELLDMVFRNLDQMDLVKVRLTSKRFDAICSGMLFQSVTIALRYQTLQNLENIMQHTMYRRNVRQITFNVSHYEDIADNELEYIQKIEDELDKELKTHVHQACHYHRKHMSKLATHVSTPILYTPSCMNKASCNPKMILELQSWITECRKFTLGSDLLWHQQAPMAISRGKQCYFKLLQEQKAIITGGAPLRVLQRVLFYIPQIESLRVAALNYSPSRTSIMFDNGYGHIGFCLDRVKAFQDPQDFELYHFIQLWNHGALRFKELIWREPQSLPSFEFLDVEKPGSSSQISTLTLQVERDTSLTVCNMAIDYYNVAMLREMLPLMDGIQSLSLFGDDNRSVSPLQNFLPGQLSHNLSSFSIRNMAVMEYDLEILVDDQSLTLLTLALDKVYLKQAKWRNTISYFRTFMTQLEGFYIGNVFDRTTGPDGFTRTQLQKMASTVLRGRPNTLEWMYIKHKPGRISAIAD